MGQLRKLSLDDMARLRDQAQEKSEALYKQIASMSTREKVLAGAMVYASGFALPFARAAGMHDELIRDYGFNEVHPVVSACYDTIVSGVATEMIPRLTSGRSRGQHPEALAGEVGDQPGQPRHPGQLGGPVRDGEDHSEARLGADGDLGRGGTRVTARHDRLPPLDVLAAAPVEVPLPRVDQGPVLALVDVDQVTVLDGESDVMADQPFQVLGGIGVNRGCRTQQLIQRLIEQRGQDLVLTGEMTVQSRPGQPGPGAQLVDADAVRKLSAQNRAQAISRYLRLTIRDAGPDRPDP